MGRDLVARIVERVNARVSNSALAIDAAELDLRKAIVPEPVIHDAGADFADGSAHSRCDPPHLCRVYIRQTERQGPGHSNCVSFRLRVLALHRDAHYQAQ